MPVLEAPDTWHTLAFMSDVHLHPSEPETFRAWADCLTNGQWDALFILGDLFEVWVGDDTLTDEEHGEFWRSCVRLLHQRSQRTPVYFMPGNRDFLFGADALAASGMCGLNDPTVLHWGVSRWVLAHGDALCTGDTAYQSFRSEVRTSAWQTQFLARPLPDRLSIARHMREASEQHKAATGMWTDVDHLAAEQLLAEADASLLIHGHTHMPATHTLTKGRERRVLSDWDARSTPARLEVLCAEASWASAPPPITKTAIGGSAPLLSIKKYASAS